MPLPLKTGDQGPDVRQLTEILARLGLVRDAKTVFDRDVARAVRAFQTQHVDERGEPLVIDGVVGPMTWWALTHPRRNPASDFPVASSVGALPPGGSARGRAALRVALSEMANGSGESGGNNRGPDIVRYLNGIVDPPADWCAAFVSWCFDQHPSKSPFGYTLGARDLFRRCRQNGWQYDITQQPAAPGDVVAWTRPGPKGWEGHVGIVLEQTEGGHLYTIEGNRGAYPSRVNRYAYVVSRMERLLGFARIGG